MKNIWVFTQLEVKKYFRQPLTIGFGVIFPILWAMFNGSFYGNAPSSLFEGVGTIDFMFPAYVFMIILVAGLSSLPLVIAKNYEDKVILKYSFTPLKKHQYLLALYLGGFLLVMISTLTMFLINYWLFDLQVPPIINLLAFLLVVFIVFCGIASLGIIIASVIKGLQETLSIALLTYFSLLFLSGATVPLPVFPLAVRNFSETYVPYTKVVKLLQNIWLNQVESVRVNFVTTMLISGVMFFLGLKAFRWQRLD